MKRYLLLAPLVCLLSCTTTPKSASDAPMGGEPTQALALDLNQSLSGQPVAHAISYSGYREGQAPGGKSPSYAEIKEDLGLIAQNFNLIRLYGADAMGSTILEVIQKEKLPLKVMQGVWLRAELNNPKCPWGKPVSAAELEANRKLNLEEVERVITLTRQYPSLITAISVGNEALVEWTDHLVPVASVISYVKRIREGTRATGQLLTVAENYVPWTKGEDELVATLDFLTIHTYPIWEHKSLKESMPFTLENYHGVLKRYPNKPVAIGEAGWTTGSDGINIPRAIANETNQKIYYDDLRAWTQKEKIVAFIFEAFDEPWKGGPSADEPEKHWGLYTVDRKPKLVMCESYAAHSPEQKAIAATVPSCNPKTLGAPAADQSKTPLKPEVKAKAKAKTKAK